MPRTRRGRQVEFDPGTTSGRVEGRFVDEKGNAVTVVVTVRSCDQPGSDQVAVTSSQGQWRVELPPNGVKDLDGLVEDGLAVRLTIVARPCSEPEPHGDERPLPFEMRTDVDATIAAPDAGPPLGGGEY